MADPIKSVLIVGGGTAGWLTAAYLARRLGALRPDGVAITLIESSEIGIVGVGEGTFPSIKKLLLALNADEAAFMRACSATFKQGFRFVDWAHSPSRGVSSHYYHPFNLPEPTQTGLDLLPYWLIGLAGQTPLSESVAVQDAVCNAGRGPKRPGERPYFGSMNYAYHFDAGRLAAWLARVGQDAGVRRLIGNVESVELDEAGAIVSVFAREHGRLTADLYIDCTGFRAELIGKALGSPYREVGDRLFVNRALAVQAPYDRPDHPIETTTVSTGKEAGWIWDIGLNDRRGVGYVYSSNHTSDEEAASTLRRYLGPAHEGLEFHRQLRFTLGYRERPWVKNCVAIGLSAGFLEPLESTGISMIDMSLEMLADMMPGTSEGFEPAARAYAAAMSRRYELAVDFLKMHYCLSRRTDSRFWIDNADPSSWSDSLKDKLAVWSTRPPSAYDFTSTLDCFSASSYKFVLYGMGFRTRMEGALSRHPHIDEARREFERIRTLSARAAGSLPDHRALIDEIYSTAGP